MFVYKIVIGKDIAPQNKNTSQINSFDRVFSSTKKFTQSYG